MQEKKYYVYILASLSGTLYTGVTNDLWRRMDEHDRPGYPSFTKKYGIDRLVYYETFKYVGNAIRREKQVKGWLRSKKVALIGSMNPSWRDLKRDFQKRYQPDYRDSSLRSE